MIIKPTNTYTKLLTDGKNSGKEVITIFDFFKEFDENYRKFNNVNLILDFSRNINIDLKEILLFSPRSQEHKQNSKSFVIVCKFINFDKLPSQLIVVPTLQEAEDIIEIEDIERDLGI